MTPAALGALAAVLALMAVPSAAPPTGSTSPPSPVLQDGTWPVPPDQVVTGFDDPAPYAAGHRGVDLAASVGQTVVSAGAGQITTAGPVAGRGVVVVDHGAVRTSYLPVVALVRVGDVVAAGQPLGQVAAQAHCPAVTCLHWGARVGDRYVDPRSLLASSGPVVLLPLDP